MSGGSDSDPTDIAPESTDVGAAGDESVESTETADEGSKTAQEGTEIQTGGTNTGGSAIDITLSDFSGRYKTNDGTGTAKGTGDETSSFNISFSGGSAASDFTATLNTSTWKTPLTSFGSFSFGSSGTSSPFGPVQGTGFLTSDQEFLFFEVTEDNFPGERALLWGGKPFTATVPTSGVAFFSLQDDFALESTQPFVLKAGGGSLTPFQSESTVDAAILYGTGTGAATALSGTAQRAFGHASAAGVFNVDDSAVVVTVIVGEVRTDSDGKPFIQGVAIGSSRLSETALPRVFSAEVSTATDALGNSFFGGGDADYFVLEAQDVSDAGVKTGADDGVNQDFAGAETTFFPNNIALPGSDSLDSRTSRDMFGYSGGAIETISAAGARTAIEMFQNKTSDPGDIEVFTSASTNKLFADVDGTGTFSTIDNFELDFGDDDIGAFSDTGNTSGNSAFIDDLIFAAVDAETTPATFASGSAASGADLYFLRIDDTDIPSSVTSSTLTLCDCDFLTWGFWGGSIDRADGTEEVIHLASWVAGEIPALSAISALTGSATYAGHVIATVKDTSGTTEVFQEFGAWNYTFSFDTPSSSSGTISNFDNGSYTINGATLAAGNSSRNKFSGTITGSSGDAVGQTGNFLGSFMKEGSVVNAGMGGHVSASGTDIQWSGVFVAEK